MSQTQGGLNVSGTFTGDSPVSYQVVIDGTSPDTFKWRDTQEGTWNAEVVTVTESRTFLSNGLAISFYSSSGYTAGDSWSWTSEPTVLSNTKDGVLLSKDGVHNLVAMTDGEIDIIDNITSPAGTPVTASRPTSTDSPAVSAMTVHNKEVHIGHGKSVSPTWAGYVENNQWGKKTEGFHVTDANVTNYAAVGYADYICGDGTNLFFGSYRGGIVFKTQIADPANITKNQRDFKDICGMIYDNSELWVLVCDSITSDNYTLHQVNTDDLTIEHSHVLILPTDAFVGADSTSSQAEDHTGVDYSSGGVIFSDMIITGDVIWFAAYKDSKVVEEVVLWNSDAPVTDGDEDLTLTNRSPGIRAGSQKWGGRADEGWICIPNTNYKFFDVHNANVYHMNSWYKTLYRKSLIKVDDDTVGWYCRYADSAPYGNNYQVHRAFRVSRFCQEANNDNEWPDGEVGYIFTPNTGSSNGFTFMNIIKTDHVKGSYEDDTAGLVLLNHWHAPKDILQAEGWSENYAGYGAFMVNEDQPKIWKMPPIGGRTHYDENSVEKLDTSSKWFSSFSGTHIANDTNEICKLGYYNGDYLFMTPTDVFPTIDKIQWSSTTHWTNYTPDIIESIPLTVDIETIGDGDDTSTIDMENGFPVAGNTLTLADVSGFAYGGSLTIGDEIITYTGRSADSRKLTGCKRGKYGTTDVSHSSGVVVEQAREKYFWKTSYTYDGYQESPLVTYTTPSTGLASGAPNFNVTLTYTGINDIEPRITHINLYRASNTDLSKNEPEGFFRLVKSIPLNDKGWDINNNTGEATYLVKDIKSVTVAYDARTSISEVIPHTSINYGLSTEINSMLVIGRGDLEDLDDVEQYLFKSKVHNYDIFDWTEDLLKLPSVPTALTSFSGRIYAFDENNTYRINSSGFYIEDTFEGVGCIGPNAVITTEFGMFFCDDTNIYLHNGTNAVPIGDPIVRGDDNYAWQNRDTSFVPIVGFEPKRGSFLVFFKPTMGDVIQNSIQNPSFELTGGSPFLNWTEYLGTYTATMDTYMDDSGAHKRDCASFDTFVDDTGIHKRGCEAFDGINDGGMNVFTNGTHVCSTTAISGTGDDNLLVDVVVTGKRVTGITVNSNNRGDGYDDDDEISCDVPSLVGTTNVTFDVNGLGGAYSTDGTYNDCATTKTEGTGDDNLLVDVTVASGEITAVVVGSAPGTGYALNDTITISGLVAAGFESWANDDATCQVDGLGSTYSADGTYSNVATTGGSGDGNLTVNVTIASGDITNVVQHAAGVGYDVGDTVTISGLSAAGAPEFCNNDGTFDLLLSIAPIWEQGAPSWNKFGTYSAKWEASDNQLTSGYVRSDAFNLTPGETYIFSWWGRFSNELPTPTLKFMCNPVGDSSPHHFLLSDMGFTTTSTFLPWSLFGEADSLNTWHYYTFTFTVPSDYAADDEWTAWFYPTTTNNSKVWIDEVSLNKAAGYYAWAYNLARKRWDLWEFHDKYVPQRVIAGPNGEVYVATDNSIIHYLAGSGDRTWEYQTKEITLGADTQDKRFYKIKKIGTADLTYGVNDSTPDQPLTDEKLQTEDKKSKSIKIKATSKYGEVDSLGIVYRRLSVK
jgi:hypothetical protein